MVEKVGGGVGGGGGGRIIHTEGGAHTRRGIQKVVHTKGGLWPPQESCYLRGHRQGGTPRRRRRRRCGPPVGRTRGTSPWCPSALTGLTATERGVSVPTCPAKHHGGGSPLRLLLSSPGPHNVHALPPYMS